MDKRRHMLLIVEDHDATRRTLARLMSLRGWEVQVASTLAEGIDLLDNEPEWLILDLMLPDGEGESVLRRIKEAKLTTRVAVTTAEGDEGRLEAVRRLGPEAVLCKPISFEELCRWCEAV